MISPLSPRVGRALEDFHQQVVEQARRQPHLVRRQPPQHQPVGASEFRLADQVEPVAALVDIDVAPASPGEHVVARPAVQRVVVLAADDVVGELGARIREDGPR